MQTILVTGGTGIIGKTLVPMLQENGYKIFLLTRKIPSESQFENVNYFVWDIHNKTIDVDAIKQVDYIVHLAGASVMDKKWTAKYMKEIENSRTESSKLLVESLNANSNEVKAIISSSAVGWYGEDIDSDKAFTEEDPSANNFLGITCKKWEESISQAENIRIRVCKLRTGIVLSKNGGALQSFTDSLKFRIAAIPGNGKQRISWIHVKDHCRIILHAIQTSNMSGVYNAVAPMPVTNKAIITTAAKIRCSGFYIPIHVPAFMLKLIFGKRSFEILKSTTVSCTKLKDSGFTFLYPSIDGALSDLLS